ncbi:hypothetical protein CYMTET_8991 [Cymbomonas tetramitiformis]|uniref:BED-type domain-containing protein n=1 Tax=Cymbomonas tetramitiformis TaxID=36881 RepID=A0AAE0GSC3_9CHLO|nr:hypothetical protein CYMTET_8991 [Cymbomonas tetramitiformis]
MFAEFDGFEEAFGGKRRSACWKHYKVQKDDTGKIVNVKCPLCPPDNKPMPFCGNTTNLRSHLASVHKAAYCKMIVPEDGGDPPETEPGKDKDSQSRLQLRYDFLTSVISLIVCHACFIYISRETRCSFPLPTF